MNKKEIRALFRQSVFERDKYRCRCCGEAGKDRQGGIGHFKYHKNPKSPEVELDAHHITSRKLFKNGGYCLSNGITVCSHCHEICELFHQGKDCPIEYLPEALYQLIDSSYEAALHADG
jgi:hypothetical protein